MASPPRRYDVSTTRTRARSGSWCARRKRSVDGTLVGLSCCDGQHHEEGRPLVGLALHPDVAIALAHDAVRHGQPQTGAAADRLRREVGIEDARHRTRIHSYTRELGRAHVITPITGKV